MLGTCPWMSSLASDGESLPASSPTPFLGAHGQLGVLLEEGAPPFPAMRQGVVGHVSSPGPPELLAVALRVQPD